MRLRSMLHLDGKIIETSAYFGEDKRIRLVHLEEEGLNATKVNRENARILFALPEKK